MFMFVVNISSILFAGPTCLMRVAEVREAQLGINVTKGYGHATALETCHPPSQSLQSRP